jgi:hypothetical protein
MNFSSTFLLFCLLGLNILFSAFFSDTVNRLVSFKARVTISHPYKQEENL